MGKLQVEAAVNNRQWKNTKHMSWAYHELFNGYQLGRCLKQVVSLTQKQEFIYLILMEKHNFNFSRIRIAKI